MQSFKDSFHALVIGASGGLGEAVCGVLSGRENCSAVVRISRRENDGFDITDESTIRDAALRLAEGGRAYDLIFDATGTLKIGENGPEKSLSALDPEVMVESYRINAVGPALLLKHFVALMPRSGRSVFATLSARVGSIGDNRLGGWYSYRASKAALNQIMHSASIEVARKRPEAVVICLHPGTVETSLTKGTARSYTHTPEVAAERLLDVIDRTAPERTGGFFAYDGSEIVW
ncbi:MAG: SDR family NAD(P)-dependent oxidoreductase [Pseudomonadota bacterium]